MQPTTSSRCSNSSSLGSLLGCLGPLGLPASGLSQLHKDCAKERSGEQCKNLGCSWCPIGRQISAGGSQVSTPVRRELRLIGQLDWKPATSFALPLLFRGLGKAASIDGLNLSGGPLASVKLTATSCPVNHLVPQPPGDMHLGGCASEWGEASDPRTKKQETKRRRSLFQSRELFSVNEFLEHHTLYPSSGLTRSLKTPSTGTFYPTLLFVFSSPSSKRRLTTRTSL